MGKLIGRKVAKVFPGELTHILALKHPKLHQFCLDWLVFIFLFVKNMRILRYICAGYGEKPFIGRVSEAVTVKGRSFYRVVYEDGDAEDMSKADLMAHLVDEAPKEEPGEQELHKKRKISQEQGGIKPRERSAPPPKKISKARNARKLTAGGVKPKDLDASAPVLETTPSKGGKSFPPLPADEPSTGAVVEKAAKAGEKTRPSASSTPSGAAVANAHAVISNFVAETPQEQPEEAAGDSTAPAVGAAGTAAGTVEAAGEREAMETEEAEKERSPKEELPIIEEPSETEGEDEKIEAKAGEVQQVFEAIPTAAAPVAAVRRFPMPSKEQVLGAEQEIAVAASRAVAVGNLMFLSDISYRGEQIRKNVLKETPAKYYTNQVKGCLQQLAEVLEAAGAGRRDLVSVNVKLKDSGVGHLPFCEQWNEWLGDNPAPVGLFNPYMLREYLNFLLYF